MGWLWDSKEEKRAKERKWVRRREEVAAMLGSREILINNIKEFEKVSANLIKTKYSIDIQFHRYFQQLIPLVDANISEREKDSFYNQNCFKMYPSSSAKKSSFELVIINDNNKAELDKLTKINKQTDELYKLISEFEIEKNAIITR